MKIAISIGAQLLQEADRAAREMGLSRSRLFSVALQQYLKQRRQEQIIEQLNRVYADGPSAEERQVLAGMKAKFFATISDRW